MNILKQYIILWAFTLQANAQYEDSCDYTQTAFCQFDVRCANVITLTRSFITRRCIYSPKMITLKIKLSYTDIPSSTKAIPDFEGYLEDGRSYSRFVTDLDLSNNGFESTPPINELRQLASLNFSYNHLSSAKFHNRYELKSLITLDLSHNVINSFVPETGQDGSNEHEAATDGYYHVTITEEKYLFKSLLYLNMSNNYLTRIPMASFESLRSLKWLDLSRNFIDILDMVSFEGLKQLEHLDLSHNRLTDINSALLRFTELKELYLNDNLIAQLHVKDFENLTKLRILNLNHNALISLDHRMFSKMTNLNYIDLSHNLIDNLFDDIFSGNITSLDSVNLSYNKLNSMPKFIFKGNALSNFSIEGNKMEGVLQRGIFDGLQNVDVLNLSYQNLSSVDNYAFFGCSKLTDLILKNNQLMNLEVNSMRLLNQLINLDISNNKLEKIDFDKNDLIALESFIAKNNIISHINKNTFANLTSLKYLDLSNNVIAQIEKYSFQSLGSLINLQLSNNLLKSVIEEGTFEGLLSLPELDISRLQLSHLNNGSFKGMNSLKKINISSSGITKLEYDTFSDAMSIETIDLSYNSLTTFEVDPSTLPNLNTLIIDHNKLSALTSTTFQQLHSLTKVSVSNNNLTSISNDTFHDLTALQFLDMSYNSHLSLHDFKPPQSMYNLFLSGTKADIVFENQTSLTQLVIKNAQLVNINQLKLNNCGQLIELDLSWNQIKQIEGDAFFATNNLHILDISFNGLSDIRPGVFKDNEFLRVLNISHNSLVTLSYGTFRGMQALDTLDLSYNFLTNLKGERFYEVPNLRNLIIDYNNIQNIDDGEFAGAHLERLSLGDNPLSCTTIIKLKKEYIHFTITCIRPDHQRENVDGITCYQDVANHSPVANATFVDNANAQIVREMKNVLENNSLIQNQNIQIIKDVLANSLQIQNVNVNQIKSLLMNYSDTLSHNSDVFSNISIQLKDDAFTLHNATLENAEKYLKQSNTTNYLLEKILNALTATSKHTEQTYVNETNQQYTEKDNSLTRIFQKWQDTVDQKLTSDGSKSLSLDSLINFSNISIQFKDDPFTLHNATLENAGKYLNNLLEKILNTLTATIKHTEQTYVNEANQQDTEKYNNLTRTFQKWQDTVNAKPINQKLTSDGSNHDSSLLFLEIGTGLSLTMMIAYISYKFYKSSNRCGRRQRSESSCDIVNYMQNSAL